MKTKRLELNSKQSRCQYCHPSIRNLGEHHCVADGWEDDKVKTVTKSDCDNCERFKSRYIEYPLTINGIENKEIETDGLGHNCGCLCEIRPCGEEYEGKTYIGFYLGDLPLSIYSSFDEKTGILKNQTMNNPAIFVPELKKIIYGCESWWREISSTDDFNEISDEDINNTWYVKLLNASVKKQKKE